MLNSAEREPEPWSEKDEAREIAIMEARRLVRDLHLLEGQASENYCRSHTLGEKIPGQLPAHQALVELANLIEHSLDTGDYSAWDEELEAAEQANRTGQPYGQPTSDYKIWARQHLNSIFVWLRQEVENMANLAPAYRVVFHQEGSKSHDFAVRLTPVMNEGAPVIGEISMAEVEPGMESAAAAIVDRLGLRPGARYPLRLYGDLNNDGMPHFREGDTKCELSPFFTDPDLWERPDRPAEPV